MIEFNRLKYFLFVSSQFSDCHPCVMNIFCVCQIVQERKKRVLYFISKDISGMDLVSWSGDKKKFLRKKEKKKFSIKSTGKRSTGRVPSFEMVPYTKQATIFFCFSSFQNFFFWIILLGHSLQMSINLVEEMEAVLNQLNLSIKSTLAKWIWFDQSSRQNNWESKFVVKNGTSLKFGNKRQSVGDLTGSF